MAVEYRNRKGEVYYLHTGRTKTGKITYHFSRKLKTSAVDEIPSGHEIYEHPEQGQVFLRSARPSAIGRFERDLVADAVRDQAHLEHFVVDVQDDHLIIYLPDTDGRELDRLIDQLATWRMDDQLRSAARTKMIMHSRYSPMLRFTLHDPEERLFCLERWCFRSSVDGWYFLAGPAPLTTLLKMFLRHLGKESFFELV